MRPTRGFLIILGVAVTLLAVMAIVDFLRPIPPEERLRALRSQLSELRAAADSCLGALESEESELLASDARFDSLRGEIDRYEDLDPRGVPADSYDAYLDVFSEYNEGIPEREAAGDTLRAHEQACRTIIEQHNVIADSARQLADELGMLRDSVAGPAR